jgi:hypothetical protein
MNLLERRFAGRNILDSFLQMGLDSLHYRGKGNAFQYDAQPLVRPEFLEMNAENDPFKSQKGFYLVVDFSPRGRSQREAVGQEMGVDPCLRSPDDSHDRSL